MIKGKTILAAVALGTGLLGVQLAGPENLDPRNWMALSAQTQVVTNTDQNITQALVAKDQDGNPVSNVILNVNYIDHEGNETVYQTSTAQDGSITAPDEDGTYIYTISKPPSGYSNTTAKVILKVEGGKALTSQEVKLVKNEGMDRSDAKQNENPADLLLGDKIVADKATESDQKAADNAADLIAKADAEDPDTVDAARAALNALTAPQKKLVDTTSVNSLTEKEEKAKTVRKGIAEADDVAQKISKFPEITKLEQAYELEKLSASYDALTESQKSRIGDDVKAQLESMNSKIQKLREERADAGLTSDAINELPQEITLDQASQVQALRKQYDALTDEMKKEVSKVTLKRLTDAEAKIKSLEEQKKAADDVSSKIEALRSGGVEVSQVESVKASYDTLSDEQRAMISDDTKNVLNTAVSQAEQYKKNQEVVEAFKNQIQSLGTITSLKQKQSVSDARDAYNALTQGQQAMVSNEVYAKLQRAEDKINELSAQASVNEAADEGVETAKAAVQAQDEADRAEEARLAAEKKAQEEKAKEAEVQAAASSSSEKPNVLPYDIEGWRPWVIKALKANGLEPTEDRIGRVLRQINTESEGDQNIVQFIKDSNSGWILSGYHCEGCATADGESKNIGHGLMQTIITTFDAYKFEGHDDIFNGYDNLLAAINYAKHAYGDDLSYLGEGHGF